MPTQNQKTVSLVLGSGGARGLAHIGVIHWLEQNGYKIESISACSMGALIGGVYAAGRLDEFETWVRAITRFDIVSMLDLSWSKTGLVKGDKIINTLTELVGDMVIEDLPITYTAVAADILNEKEVWMNSGRLFDAIRASISLPLFFTPFRHDGVDLIDGGVLNPVPIAPTFSDSTDLTIAISLGGKPESEVTKAIENDPVPVAKSPLHQKINEFIASFTSSSVSHISQDWGAYDIANQAFDAMQAVLTEEWDRRDVNLPLKSPYEALILASIIEKETALAEERPRISGVFVRRLQLRMRLQTDPTVIYGIGDVFDGNLTRRHMRTDTLYNTYTRHGLPPTPIALAGKAAITAALHPQSGNEVYFVASGLGDGSHTFSATKEQHDAAVRQYLARQRANRNQGKK